MDIKESVHRILDREECLADLFYVVFLERYPEVRRHFAGVNLKHQAVLLKMALLVIERHYERPYAATGMYLNYLGSKHHQRGIPPELYPNFRDALLAALARFHSADWDDVLATQWRDAIDRATAKILEGYRENFHV